MLKNGDVNPLNVFGLRELGHCPPHFERVSFNRVAEEKRIRDWIYENLDGRFWLGEDYVEEPPTDSELINSHISCVAFEIPAEASYFALQLDQFNVWSWADT